MWYRLGLGRLYERVRKTRVTELMKGSRTVPADVYEPMSLSQTPHVQRFTLKSLARRMQANGFAVSEARGAVIICGPVSDLVFSGMSRVMRVNAHLGKRLSRIAADFYVAAEKI